MAQAILCDLSCGNVAVLLTTQLANGDTFAVCAEHLETFGRSLIGGTAPLHGDDDSTDEDTDEEAGAGAPAFRDTTTDAGPDDVVALHDADETGAPPVGEGETAQTAQSRN